VSVGVQRYSVQCKGYNLVGVTTVEEDATRGTTTLVYLQLHISLYEGTVHVLSRVLEYIRKSGRRLGMLAGVHSLAHFQAVLLQAARLNLISNKQRLEQDIRVKENSLKIDQQKCMTLR
jgi:hypothetical protein